MNLSTLGGLAAARHRLHAFCNEVSCRHHSELDVPALATRFGPDHGAMHQDLAPKLRCTACGRKQAAIRLALPKGQVAT